MEPYVALVHKDHGSAYGITFPDAEGCFSAADTLGEVFSNAQDALAAWSDAMAETGASLPVPRDLGALKDDTQGVEAFADAVVVIAVVPTDPAARHAA